VSLSWPDSQKHCPKRTVFSYQTRRSAVGLPVNFYARLRDGTQPKSACRFPSSRSIREHDCNLLISHLQLLACGSLRLKLSQLRHCSGCVIFPIARFVAAFPLGCCVSLCHVPSKVLRDGSASSGCTVSFDPLYSQRWSAGRVGVCSTSVVRFCSLVDCGQIPLTTVSHGYCATLPPSEGRKWRTCLGL
jgi:hypothetical protein